MKKVIKSILVVMLCFAGGLIIAGVIRKINHPNGVYKLDTQKATPRVEHYHLTE